jgi:photosystem II stability/assembly factor-like uncharacterized protein
MRRAAALTLAAVALAGCKSAPPGGLREKGGSDRLVDFSKKPPYVNGLEIDPDTGEFLLTTNRGFFRIARDGGRVTRVRGVASTKGGRSSPVGTFLSFLPLGDGRFLGSGHPDHRRPLPQFLGVLESDDDGAHWNIVSRLGRADLHKFIALHNRIYAFDAVLSAMLISEDGGKTFTEHFTPRGLVIDFAVDPEDPHTIVAATEQQLFVSHDDGDGWRPLLRGEGIRLAWPEPGKLYRAMKDGSTFASDDGGRTWEDLGKLDGEPYKIHPDGDDLYVALADGTILKSGDGLRSAQPVFTP